MKSFVLIFVMMGLIALNYADKRDGNRGDGSDGGNQESGRPWGDGKPWDGKMGGRRWGKQLLAF